MRASSEPTNNDLDHLPTLHPEGGAGLPPVHSPEAEELDYAPTLRGLRTGLRVFGMRYQLVRQLGRGGMGVVWLARDGKLDLDVALKFLPEGLQDDLVAVEELRSETKRCLKLTHPLIVRTYDLVEGDDMTAIAMEFINGHTLNELRMQQPARVFEAADLHTWLQQLCEALTYAHTEARLVHRDLKPSNVMITTNGRLKLADFGIASGLSDTMSRLTRAGAQAGAGTLVYMSPQQVMGFPPTVTDDIYSLGATLYELITGKPPFFRGSIERQIETMVPPSMAERRQELEVKSTTPIPLAWERLVSACLEKDKTKRPQSAEAVWKSIQSGSSVSIPPVIPAAQAASPLPLATQQRAVPHSAPKPSKPYNQTVKDNASQEWKRNTRLLWAGGLLATAAVAAFIYTGLVSVFPTDESKEGANVLSTEVTPLDQDRMKKIAEEVNAFIRQGQDAMQRKDFSEARARIEAALSLDPSSTSATNAMNMLSAMEADERATAASSVTSQPPAPVSSPPQPTPTPTMTPPSTVVSTPSPPVDPQLPSSGYFPLDQVFDGTSYDSYNTYSRSKILTKAQEKLKVAGLYQSTPDGAIGPGTQQAIISWQRQRELPVTGKLDSATQSSLSLGGLSETTPPEQRRAPKQNLTVKPQIPTPAKPALTGRQALEENYRRGLIGEKAYRQKLAEMELFKR